MRHQVYPYGIHFAVVRVDRETGGVAVERYVIAYDIGRAINPALVEGQIVGGFAQGLGGSLLEEFTFNERGDPLATTLADYLMPRRARDAPGRSNPARGLSKARSIRSASREQARAASPELVPRSPPPLMKPLAFPARLRSSP